MMVFDDAYDLAKNIIEKFDFEAFIVFVRVFQYGWVFEYQAKSYLDTCDYLEMLLDVPYILIDKNTGEAFFVYMKPDCFENLLDNYTEKNKYLNRQLVPILTKIN